METQEPYRAGRDDQSVVQYSFQTTLGMRQRIKQHYVDTGESGAKLMNRLLAEYFDRVSETGGRR